MFQKITVGDTLRYSKMIVVFTVGMLALFVIFGNITDYCTNYNFVHHVMSMDSIKEGLLNIIDDLLSQGNSIVVVDHVPLLFYFHLSGTMRG